MGKRDEPPEVVDAEYRVRGEDRWGPFKRWVAPKIGTFLAYFIVWLVATLAVLGFHHLKEVIRF